MSDFLRAILLHVNAIFPFLYPMRNIFNGRVFTGFYHYVVDIRRYRKADSLVNSGFPLQLRNTFPCLLDRYENAGSLPKHYFWQDLWGARKVFKLGTKRHYDIGSRLDGFIVHCLPYLRNCNVGHSSVKNTDPQLAISAGELHGYESNSKRIDPVIIQFSCD